MVLTISFSLTLVIVHKLMKSNLFLPHELKYWGIKVSSVAEGFVAVAELDSVIKIYLQVGS
jgi:hypothetical protein